MILDCGNEGGLKSTANLDQILEYEMAVELPECNSAVLQFMAVVNGEAFR